MLWDLDSDCCSDQANRGILEWVARPPDEPVPSLLPSSQSWKVYPELCDSRAAVGVGLECWSHALQSQRQEQQQSRGWGGALQAAQRLSSLLLDEHFSSAPSLILHATLLKQVDYCLSQLFEISHKMQILIETWSITFMQYPLRLALSTYSDFIDLFYLELRSYPSSQGYVTQTSLKLVVLLLYFPVCWYCLWTLPHLTWLLYKNSGCLIYLLVQKSRFLLLMAVDVLFRQFANALWRRTSVTFHLLMGSWCNLNSHYDLLFPFEQISHRVSCQWSRAIAGSQF